MILLKKIQMEKNTSKNTNGALRDTNAVKINCIAQSPKKQLCFYCRILLVALHIALIWNTTSSFDQMQ